MKKYLTFLCIMLSACGVRNYTSTSLVPNYTEDMVRVQSILSKSSVIGYYQDEQIKLDFGDCVYSEPVVSDANLTVYNLQKTNKTYTFSTVTGTERTIRVYKESCKNNKKEPVEKQNRCSCVFWYLRDNCDYKDWTSYLAFPLFPVEVAGMFAAGQLESCRVISD